MRRLQPSRSPRRKVTRQDLIKIYRTTRKFYGPRNWWPADSPFEVTVGAILTQNTAWKNVEKAILNIKKENLMSPFTLMRVPAARLAKLIRPAGYFNLKAQRLRNFLKFFLERYKGSIEKLRKAHTERLRRELLGVNGIGEETADSIILYAANKPSFVVDSYTRRILVRHRFISGHEDYKTIQGLFTKLLPKSVKLFNDYHAQIVEIGKNYCRKVARCESCPLRKYL